MLGNYKPKSEFSRNVLTLMTGTTIAQAIPIAISPILTRLYSPENFGVFALFIAIVSIFSSISSGRYELAIMLPKKDENAINIMALGFIINLMVSSLIFLIVIIFQDEIVDVLNNNEIAPWLYFIPFSVFLIGCFNLLNYFNNRKAFYKDLASANIYKSIGMAIVQLTLGFLKAGVLGLISGQIFSQVISNTALFLNIKRLNLFSKISKFKMVALGKRYQNFPKYSMWATLANSLSQNLTNILISSFYSVATLGFYSLVQRVLGIPASLIGGAVGQVFFQQATKEKQETGRSIKSFKSTIKKLFIIGIPFFGILFFIIEDLFTIVFGKEWQVAGKYAQLTIPLFFIKFISSTLSSILIIYEKQKNELMINILLMTTSIGLMLYFKEFNTFLFFFTIAMVMNYIIFLLYYYRLSKGYE